MNELEYVIVIIAIIAGTSAFMLVMTGIYKLISKYVDSRTGARLMEGAVSRAEFLDVKGKLERRIQTLEAIVIDESPEAKALPAADEEEMEAASGLRNRLKTR